MVCVGSHFKTNLFPGIPLTVINLRPQCFLERHQAKHSCTSLGGNLDVNINLAQINLCFSRNCFDWHKNGKPAGVYIDFAAQ